METYEKKYKDLIARLQKAKDDDNVCDERFCCVIDEIAPELAEFEDERVRKAIVEMIHDTPNIELEENYNVSKEKAKAYDEAIKKLREFYRDYDTVSHLIDVKEELANLFPELKESEDEKVRKAIIELVRQSSEILSMQNQSNILAWLEKQGNPTDKDMKEALRTEFEKGRADAFAQMQKEWSEEDEVRLQACLDTLQAKSLMGKVDTIMTEWLKSLKNRVQPIHEYSDTEKQEMFIRSQRPHFWKPSDEQMKALHDLNLTGNISYVGQGQVLIELYNDLKKLTE